MTQEITPEIGMTLAFKNTTAEPLADIPAQVVYVWPRFRSGDYLVTLEYGQSVKIGDEWITHIDAFLSELYQPQAQQVDGATIGAPLLNEDTRTLEAAA